MAGAEERAIRKLERQIAKTQQRLDTAQGRKRRRGGLLGGMALGTVAGGLLTYYLIRRNSEDEWEQESADDAILLREQPMPTGQTAEVKPLPKLNVAASESSPTDEVAATTLEGSTAATEPAGRADGATRPASLAQPVKAQKEQPPQATTATPTEQPAAQVESPKREQSAKTEPLATPQQAQEAPLPVETKRPEIVVAERSGNTDEELAAASSNEPTPAPTTMRAEPVDGTCPASHPIKGNRGSMGAMIYHVPGGRNYERTKPEACFATTEAAEEAGYRAPRG